jgi:integrase
MAAWMKRWGYEMKATRVPGVMALRAGGFLVHGKIGRKTRVMRVVDVLSVREAERARLDMLAEKRNAAAPSSLPLFATYATLLVRRKVAQRVIKSRATQEAWATILKCHLVPRFGPCPVDAIDKTAIEAWKTWVSEKLLNTGQYSPSTANDWLKVLFVILREAVAEFDLPRDPTLRVRRFSTEEHVTYSAKEPNSLAPEVAPAFLAAWRKRYPQHFVMVLLGFLTGLRPSSLRPLRRRGEESDVDWGAAVLHVRRSHTRGRVVMNMTKQGTRYEIGLPARVMAELRRHVAAIEAGRVDPKSDLLFPSRGHHRGAVDAAAPAGAPFMMARNGLDEPFATVCADIELGHKLTPRGMRRTYQDLCRAAGIDRGLQQFICGHALPEPRDGSAMTQHYSTYRPDETRAALGKLVDLLLPPAKARRAKRAA